MNTEKASKIATLALKVASMEQKCGDWDHEGIMAYTGVVFSTVKRWKDSETTPSPRDMKSIANYADLVMKPRITKLKDVICELLNCLEEEDTEDEQTD